MFKKIELLFNPRPRYSVPGLVRFFCYIALCFGAIMIVMVVMICFRIIMHMLGVFYAN